MVNLTALERISRLIKAEINVKVMKPWSKRTRFDKNHKKMRNIRVLIKKIRVLLMLISGNDMIEMLKGE